MKMRAVGTNIIVRPMNEKMSKGGILLPENDDKEYIRGEVLSVGDGSTPHGKREMSLKEGEIVIIDSGGAMLIKTETEDLRVTDINNVKYVE